MHFELKNREGWFLLPGGIVTTAHSNQKKNYDPLLKVNKSFFFNTTIEHIKKHPIKCVKKKLKKITTTTKKVYIQLSWTL